MPHNQWADELEYVDDEPDGVLTETTFVYTPSKHSHEIGCVYTKAALREERDSLPLPPSEAIGGMSRAPGYVSWGLTVGDLRDIKPHKYLLWLDERLVNHYGENRNYDYMQLLPRLAQAISPVGLAGWFHEWIAGSASFNGMCIHRPAADGGLDFKQCEFYALLLAGRIEAVMKGRRKNVGNALEPDANMEGSRWLAKTTANIKPGS